MRDRLWFFMVQYGNLRSIVINNEKGGLAALPKKLKKTKKRRSRRTALCFHLFSLPVKPFGDVPPERSLSGPFI